jgi:hypothetical protein
MKTTTLPVKINRFPSIALGIVTAILIAGVLSGLNRSYGISDRSAFIALVVIGMALCSTGMQIKPYGWTGPFNVVGMILGTALLLLIIAFFAGVKMPFIANDRDAFSAVSLMMGVKVVVDILRGISARQPRKASASPAR